MADPGTKAIMIRRIEYRHLRAQLLHAMKKLCAESSMNVLAWQRRKQPGRAFEKISVGIVNARLLFPSHRMPGEKTLPGPSTERLGRALGDFSFGAADISDQRARRQRRTKPLDVVENRQHRRR